MIVLIFLFVAGFFGLLIFLAIVVVGAQSRAKKKARGMIESGDVDKVEARKILKTLSTIRDQEGIRLFNQLSELVERK